MNNDILTRFFSVLLGVLCLAETGFATTWYVNDADRTLDVYCSAAGNDANDGKSPARPKLSIAAVSTSEEFMPGDILYIDTGTYALGDNPNLFPRSGTEEARITVQGSSKGTFLVRPGDPAVRFTASYTDFSNFTVKGSNGNKGISVESCTCSSFSGVNVLTTTLGGITLVNCQSNRFLHGIVAGFQEYGVDQYNVNAKHNEMIAMTFWGKGVWGRLRSEGAFSRLDNNVIDVSGTVFSGQIPDIPFRGNIFHGNAMSLNERGKTLSDLLDLFPAVCVGNSADSPRFVNPSGGDFHLQSPNGYWKVATNANGYVTGGSWVTNVSMSMSPGVDFGYENEWASYTNEPMPNGGRVNAGAYGGTAEASKGHPTGQKWLYAASFNDGGVVGESCLFEWRAGGFADGDKVKLQYTHDGTKWSNIVSSVRANAERYEWTVPVGAEGAWTKWRVLAADSSAGATNGAVFGVKGKSGASFTYYVNDASLEGDVYCSAVGNDENSGASAADPKASLQGVLDTYQLLPGDAVCVDTGVYDDNNETTVLSALDEGSTNGVVTIRGSTNGTVFAGSSKSRNVMEVSGSCYDVRDIAVSGGKYGLYVTGGSNRFERIAATNNVQGIRLAASENVLERVLAWANSEHGVIVERGEGNTVDHSVLWENGTSAVSGATNTLSVANSVLGGSSGTVLGGSGIPVGDYNLAKAPRMSASCADSAALSAIAPVGSWGHTVARDPKFVNAQGGNFHLAAGSPAIDAGNPSAAYANEPKPNGGRLNIGLYGNTKEATKSGTNAWVQLLSFADGGTLDASVTNVIRWNAGNLPSGAKLTLWLKRSENSDWEALATGLNASSGEYEYWKAVTENKSALGAYLKLSLDGNDKVASESEIPMIYRDGAFSYYVNDDSTEGDVYCTVAGSPDADGLSASTPMPSLESLMAKYDTFAAGDTIYVDTGTYSTNQTAWLVNRNMRGEEGKPIRIFGSTNAVAGGSVIGNSRNRHPIGMSIGAGAQYLEIKNLVFTNVQGSAVTVSNASHVTLDGVQVRGASENGIWIRGKAGDVKVTHSAAAGCGVGLALEECTDVSIEQCVFVDNTVGVSAAANSGAVLQNSALSAVGTGQVLYKVATNSFTADYNGLHAGGNARVSTNRADSVHGWQTASGLDVHSVPGDPLFADARAFDYHLMTERTLGRWMDNGQRTTDEESSPLLAAGKPGKDGTRPNIGMHGGTARASLAPAGKWLRAVSFNDAGGVGKETVVLRWVASPAMSNQTVKVEVSGDGGKTWKSVKTKVAASAGEVSWTVGTTADTPAGVWRVVSETDQSVSDECDAFFAVRKAPLKIYVATADTNETLYVTGVGKSDNWEATVAAPLNSLALALEKYDLEGGDTVYVDRGTYAMENTLAVGLKQSGTAASPVKVTGMTNRPFGGTVVALENRRVGSVLLDLDGASNIRFENMTFSNAWTGVQAKDTARVVFDRTRITHATTNALLALSGADLTLSHSVVDDSVYAGVRALTGGVVRVTQSYIPASAQQAVMLAGGAAYVTNSILDASGLGKSVYVLAGSGSKLVADCNDIRAENNANVATGTGMAPARFLYDWQSSSGNDMHSVGYEPLMVDAAGGDYHLRSVAGRYDAVAGKWVKTDKETSRLIDLGATNSAWSAEPNPNGSRANIGVFGGTSEASKSAVTNFIAPLTMSDGGTIRGEVNLSWTYSANLSGSNYVNVLLSIDGGHTWTNIQTNVYLNAGAVKWNSTNAISTGQGVWKVELATDKTVYGQTETLFAIKNDPLTYYVNDASTNGDVYCTARGSAAGSGTKPGDPIDSLSGLLGKYKLEAGDKVYVDTGTYAETGGVVFSASFGVETNWLTIQGSTNRAAGGTVITNSVSTPVIDFQGMGSVDLRDLTLAGGRHGVLLSGATSNHFWRVASVGAQINGFDIGLNSSGNAFDECAAVAFGGTGLVMRVAMAKGDYTGTNEWNGGIFITKGLGTNGLPVTTSTVVSATSGRLTVQNSVFCMNGSKDTALVGTASSLSTDHNDYWRTAEGALLATWVVDPAPTYGVQQQAVDTLSAWRALSGLDGESYCADPLWADAAGLDFHPKSEGGRYDQAKRAWTNDKVTSPLIGTGAKGDGVRRGVGWYGSTGDKEASRIPKNVTLVLLDYADGGVARGIVTNRWIARGSNLSETVSARYVMSTGGRGDIGTVSASKECVTWDTTKLGSDGAIRWGFATFDEIAEMTPFTLHNGALTYYVNDANRTGDVYCTAVGSETNTGLSASSPLPSLAEVLTRYDLDSGDVVKWDAGAYQTGAVTVDWRDSGTAAVPVTIQGAPHGKTKVRGILQLANAQGVAVQNLAFDATGLRGNALEVNYSGNVAFDGVDVTGSDWSAMKVSCSTNVLGTHMVLANAKTNGLVCEANYRAEFRFMTIASNKAAQVVARQQLATGASNTNRYNAFMSLSNNVLAARGNRVPIYDVYGGVVTNEIITGSVTNHVVTRPLYADHNNLHVDEDSEGKALIAMTHGGQVAKEFRTVNAWYNEQGQDAFSLSYDPLFADGRGGDFHLKSTAGRYDATSGKWVTTDKESSPALDAGDALVPVGAEPSPNGGRVNLGRYGGTDEASKTPAGGGLTLIALNDGGRASGTKFPITWLARGDTTNAMLTIRYIDGTNTTVLTTNALASKGVWEWNTTSVKPSVQGQLEVVWKDGTTERTVRTEAFFSVRNEGDKFNFYVNDTSRTGDVYCTKAGDNNADGLTKATPMADLNRLLEKYKLESGDTVWVDTGIYATGTSPWRITQDDSAEVFSTEKHKVSPVTIQGSTNSLYGGTVLNRNGNPMGIQVDYAIGLAIKNVTVSNTSSIAVALNSCHETSLEWMTVGNAELGIQVSGGSATEISRCVLHDLVSGVSVGGSVETNTVFPKMEHSVVWKPLGPAVTINGNYRLTATHNVFAPAANQYAYSLSEQATLTADYNAFVLEPDARVFQRHYDVERMPTICETVGAWVTVSGQDAHSYDGDADFADVRALDFHLKSRGGRYEPATKKFVTTDKTTSPLVDAGNPEASVGGETADNGGRINIGLYGGTAQASRSDATGRYNLLTFNNGGVASGRVALNWNALGEAMGTTVRIEVSLDNGKTWPITVGEGIDASIGGVLWNSAERGASAVAKWRMVDEAGKVATAASPVPFILHNSGISYYVNDDEPVEAGGGDYCTAPGSSANDGLTPATPKRWLSEILSAYNLEPGDTVYIDSGVYQPEAGETIGDLDAGEYAGGEGTRVTIIGQTNVNAGSTLYVTSDPEREFLALEDTCGIRLSHIQFTGASNAVKVSGSTYVDAEWLRVMDGWRGMSMVNGSSNVWIRHSVFDGNSDAAVYFSGQQTRSAAVENSVLWGNRYGVYVYEGTMAVSNSVVGVDRDDAFAYYARTDRPIHDIVGDYNDLYLAKGNMAGLQSGEFQVARTSVYARVSSWSSALGLETHSLVQDPLFVDAKQGNFHLKSAGGHWDAQSGWVMTDGETSPLIDAGSPDPRNWVNEPSPNGRRLNIGLYGGTAEASRTPGVGWITALSLVDGGSASGETELRWQAGGAATNDMVTIEFSCDGGATWKTIVSDWDAGTGGYLWDSTEWGATAQGMWRIRSQRDGRLVDGSMVPFVLRNGGSIAYYVNDDYEQGDTYCTADGSDANDGLTPETPKRSLQAILDAYELSPEDVVYVDAGMYEVGTPALTIDGSDSGWTNENLYVTIQGSTNPVARTVFWAPPASASAFDLSYAENVKVRDLTVQGAQTGMRLLHTIGCELENVRFEMSQQAGLSLDYAEGTKAAHSVFWNNLTTTSGVAVAIGRGDLAMNHCVLWGSWTAISLGEASGLSVSNSVLDARGMDGRIYAAPHTVNVTNMLSADYNDYSCRDGALIAEQEHLTGGSDYYGDLQKWYAASGRDGHSIKTDPMFVEPIYTGDFHLQSAGGYFTTNNWWETDDHLAYSWSNSYLLAAGDPSEDAAGEPMPNGGVVNIGAYGGTAEASLCWTNDPWVRAMALNEKCVVSAPVMLHWTYGGVPDDTTVKLEYSTKRWEAGSEKTIATNIPISAREFWWNITESETLALELQWRIVVEGRSDVAPDASDAYVSVKTQTYEYYINDDETAGDVYCTQVGSPWTGEENQGRTNSMPLDSLHALLGAYPVGAGDIIYIDTGRYDLGDQGVTFGGDQSGMDGMPMSIVGSTNGSVFASSANGFVFQNMRQVVVSNVAVQGGAKSGFLLQNVSDVELAGIRSMGNMQHGVQIEKGASVTIHHSVLADNGGYGVYSAGNIAGGRILENVTLANNSKGGISTDKEITLSDSIVASDNAAPLVNLPSQESKMEGDYNLYWTSATNGLLATNAYKKTGYRNLKQWQTEECVDAHSWWVDPLFADSANGDYHLQSRAGFWNGAGWTNGLATSWGIDAGNPALDCTLEPKPNGGRRNLGAYGGTGEASKTDEGAKELAVVSLRDGGVATIGQLLLWSGRGLSPSDAVRLEYSEDNGKTWKLITTSTVGKGATGYEWEDKGWTPSPLAKWRVVLTGNTNVVGQTPATFVYRPTPLVYYVNDLSREGDVYTSAIGNPANNGYQTNSPLDSVEAVLARYQLTPGDSLLIDAGDYELDKPIQWTSLNAGTEAELVTIQGSTNPVAPTLFGAAETGVESAFEFVPTHDVVLRNVGLLGFTNGVSISKDNNRIALENLDIQGAINAAVSVSQARGTVLRRVLMRDGEGVGLSVGQSPVYLDSCVAWHNKSHAIEMGQGAELSMTNSILGASGFGQYCYYSATNAVMKTDYNNLFLADAAQIASINGVQYERLPQWMTACSNDIHSLSADPLFADAENGDYHLRSVQGRYAAGKGWVKDKAEAGVPDVSPMVDMGHPAFDWSSEPKPNGGRRNIGLYGGTPEASKSETNAWVMAVTAMSGGLLNGTFFLSWGYGGDLNTNGLVRLEYSPHNGEGDWTFIASAKLSAGAYYWASDAKNAAGGERWMTSPEGRWRVVVNDNTNVWDTTEMSFGLRNNPFKYYLNDGSRKGDLWCTEVGSDANTGFWTNKPKATLQSLLESIDLEPTDEIYMDTGDYLMSDTNRPVGWLNSDSGAEGEPVKWIGSPNGTVMRINANFAGGVMFDSSADYVTASNIGFQVATRNPHAVSFAGTGLDLSEMTFSNANLAMNSTASAYSRMRVDGGEVSLSGLSNRVNRLESRLAPLSLVGTNAMLQNSVVYMTNSARTAVVVRAASASLTNCTVVATKGTAVSKSGEGTLYLDGNILVAGGGRGSAALDWQEGGLVSDWNDFHTLDSLTWVGIDHATKWEKLAYWQRSTGKDANSASVDPAFADQPAGDFHLMSKAGRWDPSRKQWVLDEVHSQAIDLGNPKSGIGDEQWPDGNRRNLGAYGGTAEASKSETNFWVRALTQNDGGVMTGTVTLRWAANQFGNWGDKLVHLYYSTNGGANWTRFAANVPAQSGSYTWDTTKIGDSFNALWMVRDASDSKLQDKSDTVFALRNKPMNFYVSPKGYDTNNGLSAGKAMKTIQKLLDTYDLEGGDTVQAVAGDYTSETNVLVIWSRSGTAEAPVKFVGALTTNGTGGVRLGAGNPSLDIKASYMDWSGLDIQGKGTNRGVAVAISNTTGVAFRNVDVYNMQTGLDAYGARDTVVENSSFREVDTGLSLSESRGNTMRNLTFASIPPGGVGVKMRGTADNVLENNIFVPAAGGYAYEPGETDAEHEQLTKGVLDYNLYDFSAAGSGIGAFTNLTDGLRHWQLGVERDFRSAITNALLENIDQGDLHPASRYGRWNGKEFVTTDTDTSFAVDHGNPDLPVSLEPADNGGRINIGRFGGTAYASKGSTNIALEVRSLDEKNQRLPDGEVKWPLIWDAHLVPSNTVVYVQWTADNWATTNYIDTRRAYDEYCIWTIQDDVNSACWRVISEDGTLIGASTNPFIHGKAVLDFLAPPYMEHGLMRFKWVGAKVGYRYVIKYSDDFGKTWQLWPKAFNGPEKVHRSNFVQEAGDTAEYYIFEDITSFGKPQRWYRLFEVKE